MEAGKDRTEPSGKAKEADRRRMLRIGIVALALLVGIIAWVASNGGDDGESSSEPASAGVEPKILSVEELEEFADDSGHAVYWAGPLSGKVLEVSETEAGNVQIRYLDEGTEAGGGSKAVLTIGSYPLADPAGAVKGFGERKGSVARKAKDGREVAFSVEKPTSVYFAGADDDVQVEVYDPNSKRAVALALSDQVRPVE
jgi:hypothetical protein